MKRRTDSFPIVFIPLDNIFLNPSFVKILDNIQLLPQLPLEKSESLSSGHHFP
jgi:hypothetical protein